MSLRTLFLLMGLVTTAMIAGVIYTKVIRDPADRELTVGEQRSVDRICDIRCADIAPELAREAQGPADLEAHAKACVARCRVDYGRKLLGH
ncbi:MAG: hypothetical protein R3F60_23980 [bacterium]